MSHAGTTGCRQAWKFGAASVEVANVGKWWDCQWRWNVERTTGRMWIPWDNVKSVAETTATVPVTAAAFSAPLSASHADATTAVQHA